MFTGKDCYELLTSRPKILDANGGIIVNCLFSEKEQLTNSYINIMLCRT